MMEELQGLGMILSKKGVGKLFRVNYKRKERERQVVMTRMKAEQRRKRGKRKVENKVQSA